METFFLGIPAPLLLIVAVAVGVALACGGQWYVHQRFPEQDFVRHNEVGGFMIAVAGTLYAVVLGFLTVATWQHFAEARELVALESAAAADAWHMAVGLPIGTRTRVRRDLLDYATLMVTREWPLMRKGAFDTRNDVIIMDAISATGTLRPTNMGQSNAQGATLAQLGILHDVRQRRLAENASGVQAFEWLVLLVGASCLICFCWLFGLANRTVHMLMTSCVAIIVTSVLVLLFELQYPFRTSIGIGPQNWEAVIAHIGVMQTGAQGDMRM